MELEKFYKKFNPGDQLRRHNSDSADNWIRKVEACEYFMKDQPLCEIWPYVYES